ncbi:MAG TPA: CPBP family intramembrane glutamic endopeptidase, partial [Spirochaetia bacterium]|nr:CPBP family intramembrane glutamic endopeptidase [Spirochaetia bacterium]
MSHFGHPFNEMASAVLFGVLAGWLVVRTRSIIPGLLIHAAVGMTLDTALLLRAAGILPGGTLPGT